MEQNYLDMRCPKCSRPDRIDILAEVWIKVCKAGTDPGLSANGDHHYTPESAAACGCGFWGMVSDFEVTP